MRERPGGLIRRVRAEGSDKSLEYALNKVTGRLESATQASGLSVYACPICKAMVSHRSGLVRKPHFAHWPGWGADECENFVPGQHGHQSQAGSTAATAARRRMELRLVIPTGGDRAAWTLELALPLCDSRGTLTLDLGGRTQAIDMRGLAGPKRRRVSVDPTTSPYAIVSFTGNPDPVFVAGVERVCQGLPAVGAAVFTSSGKEVAREFPRAVELRNSETFAFLWKEAANIGFPDELVVELLPGRRGWNLALVTLPDELSPVGEAWLKAFTGLPTAPPVPSIFTVWPFLTRSSSVNAVEAVRTSAAVLSAHMMPVPGSSAGPSMLAQGGAANLAASGVERSPAFFVLKPNGVEAARVAEAHNPDLETFVSFSLRPAPTNGQPVVELAFRTPEGNCRLVPLHRRRCGEAVREARTRGEGPDYLSMPPGLSGVLRVDGPRGRTETTLKAGPTPAPHNRHMSLLPPEALVTLAVAFADKACSVELDFGGFGSLCLRADQESNILPLLPELGQELRARLRSYLLQLRPAFPFGRHSGDLGLVEAFVTVNPGTELIPHHRSLAKELAACGFSVKYFGGGVRP